MDFWEAVKPVLAGQIRHLCTVAAGYLAAQGIIDPSQSGALVNIALAVGLYLVGAVWSYLQKKNQKQLADDIARFKELLNAAKDTK
jgi:hypothetical protein